MRLVRCQQQSCCSQHTTRISFAVEEEHRHPWFGLWVYLGGLPSPPVVCCGSGWSQGIPFSGQLSRKGTAGGGGGGGWGGWGVRSTLPDSVTVNARELYSSCSFWSRGLLNIISSWSMWSRLSLKPAVSVLSQSIHVPTRITSRADSTRSRRASMCQP